uniref:Uncharacterized protein n=1 Tax=Octopus bimaculoides TaxID=37653 RepID=A0A0L8HAH7_OCTBM
MKNILGEHENTGNSMYVIQLLLLQHMLTNSLYFHFVFHTHLNAHIFFSLFKNITLYIHIYINE